MAVNKERLDVLVFEKGLSESREKAKKLIMTGNVFVNGQREDKAGTKIDTSLEIIVKSNPNPYVSRGGLKLEKAMAQYPIDVTDKICMDVGASTGGFTDCMLQNGAKKVYSIDVGRGQLAWKLRQDPRVICMEKTNIRYVEPKDINDQASFVSIDVSFISLKKVLIPVKALMADGAEMVCLIKPQFEAGREKVGKKGVVRDIQVHKDVVKTIVGYAHGLGFKCLGVEYSPIKGPEGNIEYLLYVRNEATDQNIEGFLNEVDVMVNRSHSKL